MPNDLLQRPQGNDYDNNWQPGAPDHNQDDGLEDSYNNDNSGNDGDNPSSKAKKNKSLDGDQLAGAEAKAGDKSKPSAAGTALPGEGALPGGSDSLGKGFTGKIANQAAGAIPAGRIANVVLAMKNNKRKSAGIGGLAVTIVIILMSFLGGSFELIHVRENLLGNSPFSRAQKSGLTRRQGKAVARIIKQLTKTTAVNAIANDKFADSFRKKGFDVEFADRKLTKFAYTGADGVTKELTGETFDTKGLKTATKEFFEGDVGREISGKMDEVINSESSLYRGVRTTKLYAKLGVGLQNWLDRGIAKAGADLDDIEIQEKVFKEMALNDGAPANNVVDGTPGRASADFDEELSRTDPEGNPIADEDQLKSGTTTKPSIDAADAVENGADAKLADNLADDLGRISIDAAEDIPEQAVKAGITGAATSAIKGFLSPTEVANQACKLKGAAQYVGSIRNVLLALELGKLSMRFLSASDHNKTGVLSGDGLALLMKYMHANKGYLSDGGLQFHMGNASARPAKTSGMFNLSRRPQGTVGKFLSYVDSSGLAKGCVVVTNGWFQIGQAVVMGLANIPSLGSVGASSLAVQALPIAIIGAGVEITLQIGTSLAAKMVKQEVLSGIAKVDGGELAGAAVGAGFGSQMAMTGSVNGSVVSTRTEAAYLRGLADQDRQYALSKASLFDKYFSLDRYDSLASQIAFKTKTSTSDIESVPTNMLAATTNLLSAPLSILSTKSYAAANEFGCDDPQLTLYNIETDPYCNPLVATSPDVDLDNAEIVMQNNGMIDSLGNPVAGSPYEKFVNYCFSGRTGLLYAEKVDKNGIDDGTDGTCIGKGLVRLNAIAENFTNDPLPDNRPWFAKLLNPRAVAAPTETTREPTTLEYFTAWYGYMGDVDDIMGTSFTNTAPNTASNTVSSASAGTFQAGVKVPSVDTSALACPISPTVQEIGVVKVFATGAGYYNIKLCNVHGYSINAVKAKDFDDMYNAMITAGFKPVTVTSNGTYSRDGGGGNFRSYETQATSYARDPNRFAPPGGSYHERGLAVDTSCANKDNSALYNPGSIARGITAFTAGLSSYPCLNWIHNNSSKYGLLLQCDGKGSGGKEISVNSGGCEPWHISPDGK